MSQKIVISRIQHRRGLKENLPQPLLPGEIALAIDEGELWIGGDPNIPPWGIRVYDTSLTSTAETIVQNHILDVEFDNTFDQQSFNTLVNYLTTSPTPAVVLESEDIRYDGLQHVFIIADPTVDIQNTLLGITSAIQNGANPVASKFVSSAFLGERAPFPDPAFDVIDGVFLLGSVAPESNGNQSANAAMLVNRYNGAGIVTTVSNIRVPTAGTTVGQLVFRDIYVQDVDPWNNWTANGSFSAQNTIDNLTFVSGTGIDIDIDTDNGALRITNTSIAASLNLFTEVVVTDDDTGLIWAGLGTLSSSGTTDTLTIVAGIGVELETDTTNNALVINSTSASDAYAIVTDGTNSATAVGVDTLHLRSANNILNIGVTNNDVTYGDNALFTVTEGNINHNALGNYVANEHIDWTIDSGSIFDLANLNLLDLKNQIIVLDPDVFVNHANVEINGVSSITGGGNLTATRTLSLVGDVLSPGNDYYYGTNTLGDKGWYLLPQQEILNDSPHTGFVPTETQFILSTTYETIAAQTAADFNGAGNNGTFTGGVGYVAADTVTLSDGTVVTINAVSTDVETIAAQTQINFDGVGGNGTFTGGEGYVAADTVTLSDGTVVTINSISTDVETIAAQTQINFDGVGGNGTFVAGTGYGASDTVTLSDGTVVTINTISTDVETIAAQTQINFDGVGGNGTFVSGLGYAAANTITLTDGTVITVDAVSTDVRTIAAQTETNFDDVGSNGTFTAGSGYAAANTITLNDGSVITVDTISADVSTISTQTETNFDGVGSNGTFTAGSGYAAADTVTLNDGSVITVNAISANVSTIAAQTEVDFDGVGSNGTFVGGDGAGGTAYVAADTITLSDGTVITVNTVDVNDDVATFTVTSASTSGFTTGATLTQASTSGTGTGFTLTTGTNNEAAIGDIATFTITTDSTSGFTTGATLTQSSTSGTGTGFTLTTGTDNEAAFGDITAFTITTASTTPYTAGDTLTQSSTTGTGTGFTLTTAANNEDPEGDVIAFTITSASTTPYAPGATLTQTSTSGTGTGFTLTTAANNEDPVGDVTGFTITSVSTTPYTAGGTLTQTGTSGTGTGFSLTTSTNNEAIIGDVAAFTTTTSSTTPYTAGGTLTQTGTSGTGTGFSLTTSTNNEDPVGDSAGFTITSSSTSVFTTGATLAQTSTSGTGTGFSLTTGSNNEAPSSVSSLIISGFAFDIDAVSDIIFVDYSLNSGGAIAGGNNFTAIGTMKVVANANAETGLATLIDDQTDVRDAAYPGAVSFGAQFVSGAPNEVQIRYSNTLTSDATMRIVTKRWMSY